MLQILLQLGPDTRHKWQIARLSRNHAKSGEHPEDTQGPLHTNHCKGGFQVGQLCLGSVGETLKHGGLSFWRHVTSRIL